MASSVTAGAGPAASVPNSVSTDTPNTWAAACKLSRPGRAVSFSHLPSAWRLTPICSARGLLAQAFGLAGSLQFWPSVMAATSFFNYCSR